MFTVDGFNHKKVMVIAPHADDEDFGCGALLARIEKTASLHLLLVATYDQTFRDGTHITAVEREKEFLAVANSLMCDCTILGKKRVAGRLEHGDVLDSIQKVLDRIRPEVLFFIAPSFHQDHVDVHDAVVAALRPQRATFVKQTFTYEVPNYTWYTESNLFVPNVFLPFDDTIPYLS